jgi:hypothetical protein
MVIYVHIVRFEVFTAVRIMMIALGLLVVSVLATGPRVRGFRPS